jgi:hypothetical protein
VRKLTIRQQLESYFGEYKQTYCEENGLFVSKNAEGQLEYKTRAIVKPQQQVIETDLDFTLGEWQKFTNEKQEKADVVNDILYEQHFFDQIVHLYLSQGMIIGITALKVGFDDYGRVKIGVVPLYTQELEPTWENGEIVKWTLTYDVPEGNGTARVQEIYTKEYYQKTVAGNEVKRVPNRYGKFWIFPVKNQIDLTDPDSFTGVSEWSEINALVDTINSTQSRIDRIEDIYADPRFLMTGVDAVELKREHKAWIVSNPNAKIEILEYKANAMNSMLTRIEKLEKTLKTLAPELMLMEIGQLSGESRRQMLQKTEKKINRIRSTYFPPLERLAELIYEMTTGQEEEFKLETDVVIPADRDAMLKEGTTLTGMGVISVKTFTEQMGYDYDEEQKQIQEEGNAYEVSEDEISDDLEQD